MFLPRSTFQIAALCITLFSSFVWFFGSQIRSSSHAIEQNLPSNFLRTSRKSPSLPWNLKPTVPLDEPSDDPIREIQNRTLGFQKIYAVSMPHRVDKRDYLSLMAMVSHLDIEFIDGVNGSLIHPSAWPSFWKGPKAAGTIGCWRAHINIYQTMVQQGIQSALVLEDDADWDVLIKSQMTEFARGVRYLQNSTLPMHSPYGDNWDLLAVGHTGVNNKPNLVQKYWIAKDDPTVVAPKRRGWSRVPDLSAPVLGGDHTRLVHEVRRLTGTAAYAVSLRGAARILYDQTMLPNADAIDVAQSVMCRYGEVAWGTPFCFGAYPMIFGRYRAAGPVSKDSDRRVTSNEEEEGAVPLDKGSRKEGTSEFTVFPVSLNIVRLLNGQKVIPAQDPKSDLVKEVDLEKVVLPRGEGVVVGPEEYASQVQTQEPKEKSKERRWLGRHGHAHDYVV